MPIGERKRTDRDRQSQLQSQSPSKSPATKIPKSRKGLYQSKTNVEPCENNMDKILQELVLIKQGQKNIQDNQIKILDRVGAVETELNSLKTEVEGVKTSQENVKTKVDMVERKVQDLNFEINRLEQYSRKSSIRIYGIREEEREKMTEKVLNTVKQEIGVELTADEIDITHRAG